MPQWAWPCALGMCRNLFPSNPIPHRTNLNPLLRNLLSSSDNFITYLSAYSVFLSSITGVMITDYYLVRRGYYCVQDLYSASRSGPYFFTAGIHWRGYVAYICGILINIVGFVGAIGKPVPKGATYVYNLNFFCGFLVAGGTYWGLCRWFPIPATSDRWMEVGHEEDFSAEDGNAGSAHRSAHFHQRIQDDGDKGDGGGMGRRGNSKA